MHFFVTVPLWLGAIIFIIKVLASSKQPTTVQRTIKAPDGREMTVVVPASEPFDVTIARMYPGSVTPAQSAALPPGVLPIHVASATAQLSRTTSEGQGFGKAIRPLLAVLGIFVVAGLLISQFTNRALPVAPEPASRPAWDISAQVGAAATAQGSVAHVRLKTGANIRSGPSRSSPIIRVGQVNEVLVHYSTSNGWLRVGKGASEGWVAESVITYEPQ